MDALVTLDAGTGGAKCIIFDTSGTVLGAHRETWSYHLDHDPDVPFVKRFSFDAPAFWNILCHCVREALSRSGVRPSQVLGVAATSQREGCVFLDAANNEIYAGPNLDARGFREGLDVIGTLGTERLHQITGHSAPFIFPIARYLWFRKHVSTPVAQILMINDWITWRLCGVATAEPSNATESMLFDLRRRDWSEEILRTFGIPAEILPAVRSSGERAGTIHADAARATGLSEGTPVFVGGADTQCSLLGAGVVEAGDMAATLGTTTPVQTVTAVPLFDPGHSLWSGCHVWPGRWVIESNAGDTGDAYLWLLDMITGGMAREDAFRLAEQLAAEGFGAPMMMFIGPSVFNLGKMALSRPAGILFPFPALHVRPDRGSFVRAFMENVGFAIRANAEQIGKVSGSSATTLTLSGGMSRSAALMRTITDIVGRPARVSRQPETAALGCAMLILAPHLAGGLPAAMQGMARHSELTPDAERHQAYSMPYIKWCELHERLYDFEV
jgi:autoinducer 2 (AI-2) kinase